MVFVNGEVDPWHALGFTVKAPNELTDTVFIPGKYNMKKKFYSFSKISIIDPLICLFLRNCAL